MVELFKSLNDINRLRMLNLLVDNSLCVCELEVLLDMHQSNVSRHLAKLKSSGIIIASKEAQWVHYHYNPDFKGNHEHLMAYLKDSFTKDPLFVQDRARFLYYKDCDMSCQWITEDKDKVLEILANI